MPSIHPLSRSHQHRVEQKYNVVTDYPNLRLHGAAAKGDIGSVQYALTHGQPANSVLDGILPLHAASSGGSELVVKLLIDFGADVNAPRLPRKYSDKKSEGGTIIGSSGSTALHFAAANGHAGIIKILLQRGADPTRTDKYGTKPETLATNFGHDECAQVLREWEAAHPPQEPGSSTGGPTTAPLADGPPSPSKSRKLQVKRSLENLLTRKGHGMTPAQATTNASSSTNAALSPFMTFGQGVDSGTASPFGGIGTPASSSSEAFATLPNSGARRPSLPHIFEGSRPSAPSVSPQKKGGHRPRSAGQGAEEHHTGGGSSTLSALSSQKRLASKISLLNIFKKDTSGNHPPPLGNASSPNLLEFLSQPAEPGIRNRTRNSIDEPRITGPAGPSKGSLDRGDRERHSPPTTAPPQRTLFFNQSSSVFHSEDQEDLPPLPSVLLPRTSRSNSQTRTGYPDYRTRTDSNVTMTSTGSSFEAQQNPASYAIQNSWAAKSKGRDRSASEGAGALGKRSPLMNEWGRDEDGNVVDKELPGVIADEDDDEDSAGSGGAPAPTMSTSPEQIRHMGRERKASKPPQLPNGPRRPSLTNGGAGGSSSSFSPAEHKRTNSTQSTKNLRFDLPAGDGQGQQRSVSTSVQVPGRSQASPVATSPTSPLAPKSTKKSLRTSASAGSLPKSKPSSSSSSVDRPYSAGGERAGKSGRIGSAAGRRPSAQDSSFDDEDHIAAEEAEGGDSFGELVPRIPSARSGSVSSGYSGRPNVQSLASPATPASGAPTLYSPTSASTVSAGGRPWAYPETPNTSQGSLPTSVGAPGGKQYSSLSVKSGSTGAADGDSRLRGASISSSKSTDTSTSSANVASNGASDSSSPKHQGPGWSTSTSTASAGTTGKSGTIRGPKLGPIATSAAVYRSPYEIDDEDSSSSEKYSKDTTPLPVLLRTVNSHAQAHALVEKAEKQILDLADLPPDSAGLSDEALSAQLAAFGETLALERRFARGEAQKSAWLSRKGYAEDSEDEEVTPDDEKNRSPRREVFGPPNMPRKGSSGTMPAMSPILHRAGSLEFNKNIMQATVRSRPPKSRTPAKSHTAPLSTIAPIRTTPSNVGPPPTDIKPGRRSEDLQLTMHGIEITKTLPTPTDSPRSNVDMAAAQSSGRNVGVDETADPQDAVVASPPELQVLSSNQRNPDITVTEFQSVPLSRVSTAPSSHEKSMTLPNFVHSRVVSSGNPVVLQGPEDYYPPRSESRTGGKQHFGGLRNLVRTLKGK